MELSWGSLRSVLIKIGGLKREGHSASYNGTGCSSILGPMDFRRWRNGKDVESMVFLEPFVDGFRHHRKSTSAASTDELRIDKAHSRLRYRW